MIELQKRLMPYQSTGKKSSNPVSAFSLVDYLRAKLLRLKVPLANVLQKLVGLSLSEKILRSLFTRRFNKKEESGEEAF